MKETPGHRQNAGMPYGPPPVFPRRVPVGASDKVQVAVVGEEMEIRIPFDDAGLREFVKSRLGGRRWDGERKLWRVPLSAANIKLLRDRLDLDDEVVVAMDAIAAGHVIRHRKSAELSQSCTAELEVPATVNGTLRPFQKAGLQFIDMHSGILLADEQGLGKTVQSAVAVERAGLFPAVIYCPDILKLGWRDALNLWLPRRTVAVLGVAKKLAGVPMGEADFIVLNYDIAAKHVKDIIALNPKALIADESHYLKNRKTARTKAVARVVKESRNLRKVMCLSGTPILNRPKELVEPLRLLGVLDSEFGGFYNFVNRYCDAYRDRFGLHADGASHLDELHQRLRESCMIRRLKIDVLEELPEKQVQKVPVELSNAAVYKKVDTQFHRWLREKLGNDKEFLESIAHFSPALQRVEMTLRVQKTLRAETLAKRTALRKMAGEGKIAAAVAWIRDFHETNPESKVLVFAHHDEVLHALTEEFPGCVHLLAEDSTKARQDAVNSFQGDASVWLGVLSTLVAQAGLTLHAASNELFVEYEETASAHRQAEDRAHRIGQKNSVNVYRLHAAGTIDDDLDVQIGMKAQVADAAIDGKVLRAD